MSSRRSWVVAATVVVAFVLALAVPLTASAADRPNSECLACHGESSMVSNAFFNVGAVNKTTACRKCHLDSLVGTHPIHYGGGNCGAVCHPGFGESMAVMVPSVSTAAGSFALATSPNVSSYTIHSIHTATRWLGDLTTTDSKCGSCHAPAACSACHNNTPVPDVATHENHGNPAYAYSASSTVVSPYVSDVCYGVVSSQTENTKVENVASRCSADGCHSVAGIALSAPLLMDSYNHGAVGDGYVDTTVAKNGTWRVISNPVFSLGQELYSNITTATLSIEFTGSKISVVSDIDPYRGIAEISIDGAVVADVDQYNATTQYQRVLWTSNTLTPGAHTFTIRPKGTRNPLSRGAYVAFDQLKVFTTSSDTIAPACISCHAAENDPGHGGTAAAHDLDVAGSSYNNTTQTGCVNGGSGCHGAAVTSYASSQYHPDSGCTAGLCHTAANHNDAAFDNPNACMDCHNGAYNNANNVSQASTWLAGHYNETTHSAVGMANTMSAGGTYSASCSTCHNPISATTPDGLYTQHQGLNGYGATTCYECHNAAASIQALVRDAVRSDTCAACHDSTSLPVMVQHNTSIATTVTGTEAQGATSCVKSGCHATRDLHKLHKSDTNGVANGCTMANCHDTSKQGWKPTAKSCGTGGTCHNSGNPHPNEAAAHQTLASGACTPCHIGAGNLKLAHANVCGTCHGNATYPALPFGKLECTSCHNGTDVGLHVYDPTDPNHYTVSMHTAAPWTAAAQGTGADGAVPAESKECSLCHTSTLKIAHGSTSTSGGSVTCIECHTNTSLNSSATVAANWTTDRCTDCHDYGTARTHDAYAGTHVVLTGTCADTGANCHPYTDLAKLHDKSWSGGAPKYQSCSSANGVGDADPTACHVTDNVRPVRWASNAGPCGQGTAGCHQEKTPTNHGTDHTYTTASDYNNTTQTGCTNSGTGCHGAAGAGRDAVTEYHSAKTAGCTATDKCHSSSTMNAAWKTAGSSANCYRCHAGNFVNAQDTTALADVAPAGHYSETTHTATGMTGTVSAGGTYSATCADCHNPVSATVADGLYAQHQGLGGGLGSTTCFDCHNYNGGVTTLVTDGARTDTCSACHSAGVLPAMVQHGSVATTVTGIEAAGVGTCQTGGCHTTLSLHALHKSNTTGGANGCNVTGCHDANAQGVKPTAKSCGAGGACHTGTIHPSEAAAHTTLASAECVACHELGGDLKLTHGAVCSKCHGNATYPTLPMGKLECTSCHTTGLVGTHVYSPIDPNHYLAINHTAAGTETAISYTGGLACDACHSLEMKPEHVKSSTSTSTLGAYSNLCVGCHEVKVDAIATWGKNCVDCHTVVTTHNQYELDHNYYDNVANQGCDGMNCHDTYDAAALHAASTMYPPQGCAACHRDASTVPTQITCTSVGCHPGLTHNTTAAHDASMFPENADCIVCHPAYANTDTGHVLGCNGCHQSALLDDPLKDNYNTRCVDCHNEYLIGGPNNYDPYDPDHYKLPAHTATPWLASSQATGTDGLVQSFGEECSLCHSSSMKMAHASTSTNGGSVTCIECHTNTSLNSSSTVNADWPNDRCTECHDYGAAKTHDGMSTIHTVSTARGCADTGINCHNYTDLAEMHDIAQSGSARKYAGCSNTDTAEACHTVMNTRPVAYPFDSCGQGSTGCHQEKTPTNHGADHTYSTLSDYNNTNQTGCTNSGNGCHGTALAGRNAVTEYHAAKTTGCTASDKCHSSSTMSAAWKLAGSGADCYRCHQGTFVNAQDTTALADVAPAGHYSETTHTATGMLGSVTAGGTYSATCANCHNPASATVADGLYAQHQGLGGGLGSTTCYDCHNATAAIQTLVRDAVRTDTCAACHTASVLPTMAQHSSTATVAAGTEAQGLGTCQTTGCHVTLDLHALHKSNNSGNANGCLIAGCHDANAQGVKPTAKSCGVGGSCHNSAPIHPSEAAAHTTLASGQCVVCHETTDLKLAHANICGTCHGNATYPTLPAGKLECTSCHTTGIVGTHVYDPADPNHYLAINHLATDNEAGISNTGGKACSVCHSLEMKPEHWKSTTNTSTLSAYANTCIGCHEVKVDNLGAAWNGTCQQCHAPASVHTSYTADHDFTTGNAACSGATCHNVADAAALHLSSLPGLGDCSSCHNNTTLPNKRLCADCHVAHPAQATVHTSAETECLNCHSGKTNVATGHASCATCHANATLVDYLQNNYTPTCTSCHNAALIGAKLYTPADSNHYGVIIHSASPFTYAYQGTGADGAVPAESTECGTCHTSTMKIAHSSTSTSTALTANGSVACTECHNDIGLNSTAIISGNWANHRCTDCHDYGAARTHDGMATDHVVSTTRGCAGSGTSCHNFTDLAKMHNISQSGGTAKYLKCENAGCHVTNDVRPLGTLAGTDSCGQGSTGCHVDKTTTNHGGKHTLDLAGSDYNNTTVSGCTNAGAGCHGNNASTNISDYHPAAGCTEGACHTSPSKISETEPFVCMDCHDGTYVNGADTVGLTDGAPAGHYSEATHTVGSMTATIGAGGTYSATCATCHNPANAGSIDYLYNQHQGLQGLGSTTCSDCHNKNAAIQTIVTDAVRTNTCTACHTLAVLPTMVMHGSTAPVVNGTEAGGLGTCAKAGCHLTLDLHSLHKSNESGNANGCTMAGCHDPNTQGFKPTPNSCGTGGNCHTTDPHNPTVHITLASSACLVCHESTDLRAVHGQTCTFCHNNPTYPALPTGKLECTSCHDGTTLGPKVYTPVDPTHYTGREASHTASASQGMYQGFACVTCHKLELKPEHDKTTATFTAVPGTYATECIACHEAKVDGLTLGWDKTCANCHTVTHSLQASKHNATAVGGTCATNLTTATVENETFDTVTAPAWPATGWARSNVVIVTSTTQKSSGANSATFGNTAGAAQYFEKSFNLSTYQNPQISFWRNTGGLDATVDYLRVAYSMNGGGSWTDLYAASNNNAIAAMGPYSLPASTTVLVRFTAVTNAANDLIYIDDIKITGQTGKTCHNVSDVSVVHNNSVSTVTQADTDLCTTCHVSNNAVPTILTCVDVACHGGIHNVDHTSTASTECRSCHSATNDIRIIHAGKGDGCNVCHGGSGFTDVHDGKTAECAQVGCHAAEAPVNANHYVGTEASHTAGASQSAATLAAWALSPTCGSCHDMTLLSEHDATTALKTTVPANVCENCHLSTVLTSSPTVVAGNWAARSTNAACIACHPATVPTDMHGQTAITGNHAITNDTQSCASSGAGCHPVSNVAQVGTPSTSANVHTACTSCHGTASRAGLVTPGSLAQGCTGNANCHTTTYTTNNHNALTGNEAIHTASSMGTDVDVTYTNYDTCANCHSAGLGLAHNETSTTATLGSGRTAWNATAQSSCRDCHNAAATTGYNASGAVVKANWATKTCDACHTSKHANYTVARHQAPAASGCTLSNGCHGYTGTTLDVRALHDKASSGCITNGTDGKGWSGGCHALDRQMSTSNMSCGTGATGLACHTGHTHLNHGPDHTYTTASDYTQTAETAGSEAGCAGSGAGCHGAVGALRDAINEFHDSTTISGCTTGDKCHTSSTMTQAWKDGGTRADCSRCHNGNFVGSIDTMALYEASSAGHYKETTHTVSAGLGNVTAGGSSTAACSVCHDLTMRNAHGAAAGGFASATKGAYVTCTECHGYNAAVSAITTDTVRTNNCASCHVAGVMPSSVMHNATTAPSTLSSSVSCGNTGIGCHNTLDLHAIHRNAGGGCTLTGCHAKNKDMTSASKACGEATGCHLNTLYAPTFHNGTAGLADGYDSDHHIAGTNQMSATYTYNSKTTACSACHSGSLGAEHGRSTSALSGLGASNCLKCHNDSATVASTVASSWPNKNTTSSCSSCHTTDDTTAAATAHGNVGTHSTGTTVTGCSDKGAGCHGVGPAVDLTTVHYSGCALTRACHSATVYNPGAKTCTAASCHPSGYNTTTYAHNTVNGTDETHTVTPVSMTTSLSAGGTTYSSCASCHSMNLKASHNVAVGFAANSIGWTNECTGCHNATSPVNVHNIALSRTWGGTCMSNSCHNTTQSTHIDGGTDTPVINGTEHDGATTCVKATCHATLDLHALHKGDGLEPDPSCATIGCHDALNLDKRPTKKSCGYSVAGGDCHTVNPHDPTAHTTTTSQVCVECHESPVLQVVHNDTCAWCHGNATYPYLPGTGYQYRECTSCHESTKVGPKDYASVVTSHYAGTSTTHTASLQTGNVGGYGCSQCHKLELKQEHIDKTTASFASTTTAIGKCIVCHETEVDVLPILPWEKTCVACHASNHLEKDSKHNATAVGGTCAGSAIEATVHAEYFDSVTAPAWPATGWTRGGTNPTQWVTNGTVVNTAPNAARFISTTNGVVNTGHFEQAFDLSGYTNPQVSFFYSIAGSGDDWLKAEYSTNGGASWNSLLATTTASVGMMQVGPIPVPASASVLIRFSAYSNRTNNALYVDSIKITGLTGSSCHEVSDVSVIHNNSVTSTTTADTLTCRVCHDDNNAVPTILTCADVTCHAGVHNQDHIVASGSTECLSCHNTTNDIRVIHQNKGDGCNVCHGGGIYTDVHAGKTSACAQAGCHISETPVNSAHFTGTEASHTAGATQMNSTLGVWALSPTCVTCHDATLLSEHSESTADKTTRPTNICENCHLSTAAATINSSQTVASNWTASNTVNACIACHAIDTVSNKHGQTALTTNHSVTNDTQSCASSGAGCHPTSNVAQVGTPSTTANAHLDCGACHDKSSSAHLIVPGALAQGCTGNAACHTVGYATNSHSSATGDDALHTASGMNTSLDTYTNNDLCSNCHSSGLMTAHKDTSTTAALGTGRTAWNATAQSTCRDCHNAPAVAGYAASGGVVKANWATKSCDACHTTKHATYTVVRHQSPGSAGCTLSNGCHGYSGTTLDVRALHDRVTSGCTAAGTDGKNWTGGCHAVDKQMSTANMSCGSGATGQACHTNHTHLNHGPDHTYTIASQYGQALDTVGSETGCTNSGAGCHGVAGAQMDAVEELHDADTKAGCTSTDKCHGSPSMTQAFKDGGSGNDCSRCHNGTFVNAADTMGLYEAASAGHYKETTHTPTGMTATVSAGGTGSATCAACHDTSLRNTHGALGGGFSSKTKGTYVTCQECHGYNAAVSALTSDTVRTDTCGACHAAGVLGADQAMHGTTAPVATGSSTAGCGAQGAGCHNTYDLHALHKDRACTLAGCHDTKNKDMTTVAKACGGATGCHLSATYTNTLHNGINGDDLTDHRAVSDESSSMAGYVKSTSCSLCHTTTLKTAHNTTPAWTTPYCLNCHNSTTPINSVNVIKNTTWANGSCSACHTVKHDLMPLAHDASVVGIGCAPPPAGGTPTTVDYHRENFDGVTAPAWPATWTKGGANTAQLVTTNASSTSSPNSARFVASAASAQSAYFEKTFDFSAVSDPMISFKYATDFASGSGQATIRPDAVLSDNAAWIVSGTGTEVTCVTTAGDGNFVVNNTNKDRVYQTYTVADGQANWTITNVTAYVTARDVSTTRGLNLTFYDNGTALGAAWAVPVTAAFAQYNSVVTPPTGGWTAASLNNLQVGIAGRLNANGAGLGVDDVYFVVDYTTASANNFAKAEYTTNGGTSWTSLLATQTATTGWTTVGPTALPMQANVTVRFTAGSDNTNQVTKFDDIVVTNVVTTPSTESLALETFDTVTQPAWPATGWTRGGTDSTLLVTSNVSSHSSPNSARFASSNTAARSAYMEKTFDLTNRRDPKISFWYSLVSNDANDYLRVQYSTNGGLAWADILPQTSTSVGWTQVTSPELPAVANVLVRFTMGSNATTNYVYVDDVELFAIPGSPCHDVTDVSLIHDTTTGPGCVACHTAKEVLPMTKDCSVVGCHATGANHDALHQFTALSNYVDGTGQGIETGCSNSGAGCHLASVVPTNAASVFHSASGCLNGTCHSSASMTTAFKGAGDGMECIRCHNGTFTGATDTTALADPAPAGHYGDTSHTAVGGLGVPVTAGGTASGTCGTCHNLSLKTAHSSAGFISDDGVAMGTKVTCAECHNSYSAIVTGNWTGAACTACHSTATRDHIDGGALGIVVNGTSTASCGASGAGCHTTYNLHTLHKDAAGCALTGCHDTKDKDMTSAAKTCGQATGCHLSTQYTATTHNLRTGDDATYHNASGNAAQSLGGYTQSTACSLCHALTLKTAHATTSLVSDPSCSSGGTGNTGCHNQTTPINAVPQVTGDWALRTCEACHTTKHGTYTAVAHTATTSGCTLSSGCHNFSGSQSMDIRALHDKASAGCAASGTDGKLWTGACHQPNKAMAGTTMTCGDTGACHNGHTAINHGPDHNYTTASGYTQTADTIGSEKGCTASGIGCHNVASTGDAVTILHANRTAGCTASDACHSDPQFADSTWRTGTTADCSRCHGGATDPGVGHDVQSTTGFLYEAASAGHYGEATHTASGMTTACAQGGTASATCTTCHSGGYRDAHGAVGTFSSTTKGAYVTCQECHGYSTFISSMTTDTVRTNNCGQCHTTAKLGAAHVVHATGPIVVTATGSSASCMSTGVGCHNTSDLHVIHKDASGGCTLTGCHAQNKDMTTAVRTCGLASGCHTSANYTATAHNGASGAGLADGDDTTHHQAAGQTATEVDAAYAQSTLCSVCHTLTMKTAHATTSLASDASCSTGGTGGLGCHNSTALPNSPIEVNSDWAAPRLCGDCHTTGVHSTYNLTTHSSSGAAGCALSATCHTGGGTGATRDLRALHDVSKGCAATGADGKGWSGTCHALNKSMSGQAMTCGVSGACHTSHDAGNHGAGGTCSNCHGATSGERLDRMVTDTTAFHHVLDAAAPYGTTDNTSLTLLSCTSCHNNHAFTGGKAFNVKTAYNNATMVNTDFINGGTYGLCLSCHSSAVTRGGAGTAQKAGGNATLEAISGATYAASAHGYEINNQAIVGYSDSAFRANCIKCHDDGATGLSTRQSGTARLAPHIAASNNLASALGAVNVTGNTKTEENLCFKCHITAAASATDSKTVANKDAYGYQTMTNGSEAVYTDFQQANRHKVQSYTGQHSQSEYTTAPVSVAPGAATGWWGLNNVGKHVECEDCHDVHAAKPKRPPLAATSVRAASTAVTLSPSNIGAWGADISGSAAGKWAPAGTRGTQVDPTYTKISPAVYEWQLCLKCHSKYAFGTNPPTVSVNLAMQTGGKQTDVGRDFSPTAYAYHPLFQTGRNQPATGANALWNSSAGRRLISGTSTNHGLSNTLTDGWRADSLVTCTDCHGSNNYAAVTSGAHGSSNKWMLKSADRNVKVTIADGSAVQPILAAITAAEAGNFCLNCHRRDVYGDGTSQGPTYQAFARMSHNGHWNASCAGVANTTQGVSGCMNCHGGRRDNSSFNSPTNATVQSGAVHGTTVTGNVTHAGQAPLYTTVALGTRFANGASWQTHLYNFGGTESLGCQTSVADSYSTCSKHDGGTTKASTNLNYTYTPAP